MFTKRQAAGKDFAKIFSLYKRVAIEKIGIARSSEEINEDYIRDFMTHAEAKGIEPVVEDDITLKQLMQLFYLY
ncbi:MAG: hypothetical protein ABIN36_12235 [Ferruginibacter sp.]